jgi:hypothetical protein
MRGLLYILILLLAQNTLSYKGIIPKRKNNFSFKNSNMDIIGRNLEVTEALKGKINSKIGGVVEKLGQQAIKTHVRLI